MKSVKLENRIKIVIFLAIITALFLGAINPSPLNGLSSNNRATRIRAVEMIRVERTERLEYFRSELNKQDVISDKSFNGKMYSNCQAIIHLRAVEIVPELIDYIDFRIDSKTVPYGIKLNPIAYYPVLNVMNRLGGKETTYIILRKLKTTDSDDQIKAMIWSLKQLHSVGTEMILLDFASDLRNPEEIKRLNKAIEICKNMEENSFPFMIQH